MFKLEVLNTAFKGKRFAFRDGLTVGSGPSAVIRAQHKDLEDIHVRFYYGAQNGKAMVEIANDKAHLYINGKDVIRSELRHNDELVAGPLRFRVVDAGKISSRTIRIDDLVQDLEHNQYNEIYDFAREDLFYLITKDPSLRLGISFSIPSKDRFIDQAQVFLARLIKLSSIEEQQVESFMTCAKELILNAHRHGHKFDESKKIIIRYRDLGPRLQLTIHDEGTGFDHKSIIEGIKNKDAASAARERYQAGGFGGLGFKLITHLANQLVYNDVGNQVTFSITKHAGQDETPVDHGSPSGRETGAIRKETEASPESEASNG